MVEKGDSPQNEPSTLKIFEVTLCSFKSYQEFKRVKCCQNQSHLKVWNTYPERNLLVSHISKEHIHLGCHNSRGWNTVILGASIALEILPPSTSPLWSLVAVGVNMCDLQFIYHPSISLPPTHSHPLVSDLARSVLLLQALAALKYFVPSPWRERGGNWSPWVAQVAFHPPKRWIWWPEQKLVALGCF